MVKKTVKSVTKSVIKSRTALWFLAYVVKFYIKLVFYTTQWQRVGMTTPENLIAHNKSFVACFWHGRLAMIPQMWQWKTPMTALVSGHQDGQLVGFIFSLFGIDFITGSTNRGGTQVLRQAVRRLKSGNPIGMTPDGPRGPREIVSPGIVLMAKLSGAPLVPVSFSVKRYKVLSTWDQFTVPFPFNKGVFFWGTPIYVKEDATEHEMETIRLHLEEQLKSCQVQADNLCRP